MRWIAALTRLLWRMLAEAMRLLRWCLYGVAGILGNPYCVVVLVALFVAAIGPPRQRDLGPYILTIVLVFGIPAGLCHTFGHLLRPGARRVRAPMLAEKPPEPTPVAAVAARGADDPNEAQIIGRLPPKLRSLLAK